jgi:hypothetical protein
MAKSILKRMQKNQFLKDPESKKKIQMKDQYSKKKQKNKLLMRK